MSVLGRCVSTQTESIECSMLCRASSTDSKSVECVMSVLSRCVSTERIEYRACWVFALVLKVLPERMTAYSVPLLQFRTGTECLWCSTASKHMNDAHASAASLLH